MIKEFKDLEKLLRKYKNFSFYIGEYPNYYCKVKITIDNESYVCRTIEINKAFTGDEKRYEFILNKYFTGYRQKDGDGKGFIYQWLFSVRKYINREKFLLD